MKDVLLDGTMKDHRVANRFNLNKRSLEFHDMALQYFEDKKVDLETLWPLILSELNERQASTVDSRNIKRRHQRPLPSDTLSKISGYEALFDLLRKPVRMRLYDVIGERFFKGIYCCTILLHDMMYIIYKQNDCSQEIYAIYMQMLVDFLKGIASLFLYLVFLKL